MVAADDEMRDAVILAHESVEKRLARPGVAHGGREGGEQRAVLRIVALEQRLVGAEADRGGHVIALGLADERMDDDAVGELERELGQVLVGAVDGIARLEARDALPPLGGDARAQLPRRQTMRGERKIVRQRKGAHLARYQVHGP